MLVEANVKKVNGALKLYINALELHKVLDTIGVKQVGGAGGAYENAPIVGYGVVNGSFALSTHALLRRDYPAEFDLNAVFSRPPSMDQLHTMCRSAKEAAKKILEHYQPVNIKVTVHKTVLK